MCGIRRYIRKLAYYVVSHTVVNSKKRCGPFSRHLVAKVRDGIFDACHEAVFIIENGITEQYYVFHNCQRTEVQTKAKV